MDEGVREIVAQMEQAGIAVRLLSPDELKERYPYLDLRTQYPPKTVDDPDFFEPADTCVDGAVLEEDAGYVVSPGLATQNLRRAAEREGVRFLLKREVRKVEAVGAGFRLETSKGDVEADAVVNVGGPHSAILNERAGVKLPLETRPLRREVHAQANPLFSEGEGTPLPIVGDLNAGIYFRPETGGRDLIVGSTDPACDEPEWLEDPDDCNPGITELYHQRHLLRLMKRFPEIRMAPARGVASLYDVTLCDWYPIADRTDLPGYFVCMGTSGSSFKTAPVLGRLMAEIVLQSADGRDVDRDPIRLELPRTGLGVDSRFLSRLRGGLQSTGTVIG